MRMHGLSQPIQTMRGTRAPLPGPCILGMDGQERHVLPGHPQSRAGQLQRGHVGQDLQHLRAQPCRQVRRNAEAQRIARGQYHAALPRFAGSFHPAGHGLELAGEI